MTKRGIPKNDLKKLLRFHGMTMARKNGAWRIYKNGQRIKEFATLREVVDFALALDEAVKMPEDNEALVDEEVQDAEE